MTERSTSQKLTEEELSAIAEWMEDRADVNSHLGEIDLAVSAKHAEDLLAEIRACPLLSKQHQEAIRYGVVAATQRGVALGIRIALNGEGISELGVHDLLESYRKHKLNNV